MKEERSGNNSIFKNFTTICTALCNHEETPFTTVIYTCSVICIYILLINTHLLCHLCQSDYHGSVHTDRLWFSISFELTTTILT